MAKKGIIPVSDELQNKVIDRIYACYDIAEKEFNCKLKRPTVDFTCRGQVAGRARVRDNHITLNSVLLVENGDNFINRTPGHEAAHLIAKGLFNDCGHGKSWKHVMRVIGQEPSRCHSYDTKNARVRRVKRFVYSCECQDFNLTKYKHDAAVFNLAVRETTGYMCRSCKKDLHYTGKQITL